MADLLANMNPQQREGIVSVDGPVLLLAGAGSGKTRVITHRIAYLIEQRGVSPDNILAVTFTNKAAKEMAERVDRILGSQSLGHSTLARPTLATFHSFCVRVLRRDIEALRTNGVGLTKSFAIYDETDQQAVVKQALKRLAIDDKSLKPRVALGRISWAKNHMIDPQEYFLASTNPMEEKIAHIFEIYKKELFKANALDFDDLLLETVRLLKSSSEVRERYNRKYKYLLIDEYQDTNRPQYELMKLLGSHGNVCVVGDEDQSIYSWRGADIKNILEFEKDFPTAQTIRLEQNYRSTQVILEGASAVVAQNIQRKGKNLWTSREGGSLIGFYEAPDGENEALFIADRIQKYLREAGATEDTPRCAVLYRTNSQSRLVEEALRRYNIQYHMVGGFSFYDRAEVKDMLSYLKLVQNPHDSIALGRVVNSPPRGIGKTTMETLERIALTTGMSSWDAIARAIEEKLLPARALTALASFRRLIKDARAMLGPDFAQALATDAGAPAPAPTTMKARRSDEEMGDYIDNLAASADPASTGGSRGLQAPESDLQDAGFSPGPFNPELSDADLDLAAASFDPETLADDTAFDFGFATEETPAPTVEPNDANTSFDTSFNFGFDFGPSEEISTIAPENAQTPGGPFIAESHPAMSGEPQQPGAPSSPQLRASGDEDKVGPATAPFDAATLNPFAPVAPENAATNPGAPSSPQLRASGDEDKVGPATAPFDAATLNPFTPVAPENAANPATNPGAPSSPQLRASGDEDKVGPATEPFDAATLNPFAPIPLRSASDTTRARILSAQGDREAANIRDAETSAAFRKPGDPATLPELIKFLNDRSGYIKALEEEATPESFSRIENLKELANAAQDATSRGETLAEFLDHAALVSDADQYTAEARVTLMTLHAAKGLEFPLVFLAGMEEGLFPHSRTVTDPTQMEEERRLCYVGMTRAMDTLIMTRARYRRRYGNDSPESSMPSRFLEEVPGRLVEDLSPPAFRNAYSTPYPQRNGRRDDDSFDRHHSYEDDSQEAPTPAARAYAAQRFGAKPAAGSGSLDNIAQFFGKGSPAGFKPGASRFPARPKLDIPAPTGKTGLGKGVRVRHPKYGEGIIFAREGDGEDAKLTVQFSGHGMKKLVEKFAQLERL